MKSVLLVLFLVVNPLTFVADRNYYVAEAEKAFRQQEYLLASQHYAHLVNNLDWKRESLQLNLAHAHFLAKKYDLATQQYLFTSESQDALIASISLNQLGYMAAMNQDFENALQYFQQGLMRYPQNKETCYNFELIAKILRKRGKTIKKPQESANDKKAQKGNAKPQTPDNEQTEKYNPQKLKDLQLNKEKAEAILKAIRNQEAQHIQQQQQKKKQEPPVNASLPDW